MPRITIANRTFEGLEWEEYTPAENATATGYAKIRGDRETIEWITAQAPREITVDQHRLWDLLWESSSQEDDKWVVHISWRYQEPDFGDYNRMNEAWLADEIWEAGWGGERDRNNRRSSRCRVAAVLALADIWDQEHVGVAACDKPVEPAPDAFQVFRRVVSFVVHKLMSYYVAIGNGITSREDARNWRCAKLAGKRAVAVLSGMDAAEDAERQSEAMEREWEVEQRVKWEARWSAKKKEDQ